MTLVEDVELALSTFESTSDTDVSVKGAFVDLVNDMHLHAILSRPELRRVHTALRRTQEDLWNVQTILHRMRWQLHLSRTGELNRYLAAEYLKTDISSFHVEMRSLLDHLAVLVEAMATKRKQVPDGSFRALRDWAEENHHRAESLIGTDTTTLLVACDWFVDLRDVRDDFVHRGGFAVVFPNDHHILFQAYQGFEGRIRIENVMFNENVADFELYAAALLARVLALLDRNVSPHPVLTSRSLRARVGA